MPLDIFDKFVEGVGDAVKEFTGKPAYFDNGMNPLISSNVMAFGYESDSKTLTLEFKGGRQYQYFNVPAADVVELATTKSPGGWFHANMQGAHARKL